MDNANNNISDDSAKDRATQLFLEHYQFVATIAFRSAPCRDLIDDIVHDVYIEFVKNAAKWDYTRDVKPLLYRITGNIGLKYWRDRLRNMPESMARLAETLLGEVQKLDAEIGSDRLDDRLVALDLCCQKLSEENRQLLEMFYFDGIPYSQLVTKFGKQNETALRKRMSRLRDMLRVCIERTLNAGLSREEATDD